MQVCPIYIIYAYILLYIPYSFFIQHHSINLRRHPCAQLGQEALSKQPCGVASKNEQQGEAIAFGKAPMLLDPPRTMGFCGTTFWFWHVFVLGSESL
jgi:hypothetical protein